jgi:hypothetical protein
MQQAAWHGCEVGLTVFSGTSAQGRDATHGSRRARVVQAHLPIGYPSGRSSNQCSAEPPCWASIVLQTIIGVAILRRLLRRAPDRSREVRDSDGRALDV